MGTGSQTSPQARHDAHEAYLHARSLLTQGRYDEAAPAFEQAASSFPDYADVHHSLGVIAYMRSDFRAAVSHFQRALQINPDYTEALLNLAITYNTVGLYESAARLFQAAAEARPTERGLLPAPIRTRLAHLHAQLGGIYRDHFAYEEALREFRRALELCPKFVDIRVQLAVSLRDSGRLVEAVEELRTALESHPGYRVARNHLGFCLLKQGNKEEAREEFERVLGAWPDDSLAKTGLAQLGGKGVAGGIGPEEAE